MGVDCRRPCARAPARLCGRRYLPRRVTPDGTAYLLVVGKSDLQASASKQSDESAANPHSEDPQNRESRVKQCFDLFPKLG